MIKALGGIPINRKKNEKMVDAVARMIDERDEIVLVITPEGTRKRTETWKRGFYYISLKANIPIALGWTDYKKKQGGIDRVFYPTGDFDKDFKEIQAFYRGIHAKHPERYNLSE